MRSQPARGGVVEAVVGRRAGDAAAREVFRVLLQVSAVLESREGAAHEGQHGRVVGIRVKETQSFVQPFDITGGKPGTRQSRDQRALPRRGASPVLEMKDGFEARAMAEVVKRQIAMWSGWP